MKKLIDILMENDNKEINEYLKINGKRKPINPFVIIETNNKKVQKPKQ